MTVTMGDVVTWTNVADRSHTVTADDSTFDSGELGAGDPFANVFEVAGTFTYHCAIHPEMAGRVVVAASTATSTPEGSPEPTPPSGSVPPSTAPSPSPSIASPEIADPGSPSPSPSPNPDAVDAGGPPVAVIVAVVVLLAIGALFLIPMPGRRRP